MSSSEEYLDSLLAAINGQQNKEEDAMLASVSDKKVAEEPTAEEITGKILVKEVETEPVEKFTVAEPAEDSVEDSEEDIPSVSFEQNDDPNRALSPDEIAAMFAQAGAAEEPAVEESVAEEPAEAIPATGAESEPAEAIPATEAGSEPEEDIPSVSFEQNDDPNRALSPDEIAAMFAQAGAAEEPAVEESAAGESAEETPVSEVESEPAEAIPATEAGSEPAEAIPATEAESEPEEDIPSVSFEQNDDPNRALSPDEIAAMFAQAGAAEEPAVEESAAGESAEETPVSEAGSEPAEESEAEDERAEEEQLPVEEEMEIDMDDEEAMSILLGLKERPEREKKQKADESSPDGEEDDEENGASDGEEITDDDADKTVSEEMALEDILSDLGEDDPELKEIGDLLKKSDNHELVDEDVLALLEPDAIDEEDLAEDHSDEGETSENRRRKKRAKKEKKGLFSFLRKKKSQSEEAADHLTDTLENASEEKGAEQETADSFSDGLTDFDSMMEMASDQSEGNAEELSFEDEESIDADNMQALLEGIPEKDEVTSKSKGKKKKKAEASGSSNQSEGQDGGGRKQSAIGRFFAMLLEEEEEDEEEKSDQGEKKEKKSRKGKKGKKGAVTDADDNEGILEELDAEEDGKKSRKKKKKKPKKEKVKEEPQTPEKPEKKLPVKMIVRIFVLCFSVLALLLIVANILPQVVALSEARNAFYKQQYDVAYEEMTGRKLSKGDQRIYEKAKIIVKLQHKVEAFDNYKAMHKPVEALDALLSGYALWDAMQNEIAEYDAGAETDAVKNQILDTLQNEYQLSEDDAVTINAMDDYHYTKRLEEITGALSMQNSNYDMLEAIGQGATGTGVETSFEENAADDQENEEQLKKAEDILPEEEIQ